MEEKIRFATAILDFSKKRGGAERYLVNLCSRIAGEGYEVHVYAEHRDEEDSKIHFHPVKTVSFPKSLRLLSFAIKATKAIENGKYDVSLGVGNTLKADVLQPHGGVHWAWFWRSLKAYDNPFLWTIKFLGRILSPKQWISGWIEDHPYKKENFSKVIAISDMVKQDMIRWYGIPKEKIAVVYNGVDIEHFHPENHQYREEIRRRHHIGSEFLILFVSNNFRMKGLGYLIKALAKIKKGDHPVFKLLILGRDRPSPYLRLAKKVGVSEEIIFIGSTHEPEKYYGTADLLVHPTFYDACSLTVLEALASGLPAVTTVFNGASRLISRREDGWVLENIENENELEVAIKYFLDEEIRRRASNRVRDKREVYSDKMNFDRMIEIFKEAKKC
jgi:UDP-glucose:(heptosyl)LPS alpha-1,3-glucosyltransferase